MTFLTKVFVAEQAILKDSEVWILSGTTNFVGFFKIKDIEIVTTGATIGNALVFDGTKYIPSASTQVTDASNVTYNNPPYSTVKDALDALLYVAPNIIIFTNSIGTVETGTIINSVTLSWTLNKTVSGQTLNQGIGSVNSGVTSYIHSGISISSNTIYTLTVTDGISASTKNTTVSFQQKRYWGVSSNTGLTNSQILALSNEFATSRATTKTLNATGGNYLYFSYPTSFGVATFTVGGLVTTFQQTTISFTNSSGYVENYYVYRSLNLQNGSSITVQIT